MIMMNEKEKLIDILTNLNEHNIVPDMTTLNIDLQEYGDVIDNMISTGLSDGTKPIRDKQCNKVLYIPFDDFIITIKGIEYLGKNK